MGKILLGDILIEKYKIININGEERLILFLNLNYEFGGNTSKKGNIKKIVKDYIRNNRINFHGGVITFVVGSIMIGNVLFNNNEFRDYKPIYDDYHYVSEEIIQKLETSNNDIEKESILIDKKSDEVNDKKITSNNEKKSNQVNTSRNVNNNQSETNSNIRDDKKEVVNAQEEDNEVKDNNIYVNLKNKDGSIVKIELEEYLVGVVGAEMPALFNMEALKAQAIIARTYALKAVAKGKTLNANESNQSYKTNNELKSMWGGNYSAYYNKVKQAVDNTKGMVLTYNGNYIEAVYHSTSNGVTESSVNVWGNYYPYLVSVDSKYDNSNVSFIKNIEISFQEISNKLGFNINKDTNILLIGKTSGNRVESVKIEDHVYKGIDFRNILGLRSADFDIEYTDSGIIFTTRGYGHGVGLSQYGANGMAKNGYNYEAILKHYYPGVSLVKN